MKITGILLSIMLFILPTVRCSVDRGLNISEKNEDKNSSYSEKSDKTQDSDDEKSDNKKADNKENKDKESDDKDSSNKQVENDITKINGRINHWLPNLKKTEPKDSEGLAYIFDKNFTLPIDFSKIEGEGQYYDEIREAVTSDFMVTQSYEIYSEDDVYMPTVRFDNHSDDKISLSQCYKNNWWWLDFGFYTEPYVIESLRGTFEPEIGNKPIWDNLQNTSPVLDALIQKIGSPTRIIINRADINTERSVLGYSLIWENTDYVLEVMATEFCFLDDGYLHLGIDHIRYYTPEIWEHEKVDYDADSYYEYIIE